MRVLDLVVVVIYLVGVTALGLRLSGRQRSGSDYFVGDRSMPWWAVCLSVVATETSVLTVISIPGGAYTNQGFGNVELAFGYIIGRTLVALVLIPLYKREGFVSAYQYLRERFGLRLQGLAAATFVITRLLAEGVRLFASAIPIKLLLDELGIEVNYLTIILILSAFTIFYTYLGGIKAVIWTDAIQMGLYLGGAILAICVLSAHVGGEGYRRALDAGKMRLFDTDLNLEHVLTSPFALPTAIIGGAILAMASHGSDQLIVQRVLATRSLKDGQRAMIGSGVFVCLQFLAFSLVGALLWSYNNGRTAKELGLQTADEIYPQFILHGLAVIISGLLVAGILAAAMGSLSSALNSMANSSVADIWVGMTGRRPDESTLLRLGRIMTLVWAVAMALCAAAFSDTTSNVYLTALTISGYTYGALLGAFLLGRFVRRATEFDAIVAFLVTIAVMTWVVRGVHLEVTVDGKTSEAGIAAPWLPPIGVIVTMVVGGLLSLRHRSTESPESARDSARA